MIRRFYSSTVSGRGGAARNRILDLALKKVPEEGFEKALLSGIREAGYSDATHSLFPKGSFNLIQYHLQTQREKLATVSASPEGEKGDKLSILVKQRLIGNTCLGSKLGEALSIMMLPKNLPESVEELHALSDEICYLANDRSNGFNWYAKRGSLSAVYSASELFMSQDLSTDYRDTMRFVDRRLEEMNGMGYAINSTDEWLTFNGIAAINVIKSLTR
jgi:ubiquinone biosynthesis protein COQ9